MTVVRAGEIELDYERSGSGPPLLAIMGMSGTSLHWSETFLEQLRPHFDVITYDHRGVGLSTRLSGSLSIRQMADDAAALLDALELDSVHVLGVSMGGMIAQELALAHPERVRTLVLGCTYCGGEGSVLANPDDMQELTAAMMSGDRERALRAGFSINISPAAAKADPALWPLLLDIAERRSVAVPVVMAQLQACMAHDTNARLGSLSMPTLVIHGSADMLVPPANGELIAARVPGSRLEMLDGVGHMFWWEQPARAAELITSHAAVHA
jgi:pimeloyl-ACP methyl ester carboxylesterase